MTTKKPIILAVDDDPEVLAAIQRDLRDRYREDYQVLGVASADEALSTADEIEKRGRVVALFLVDQRMPGLTGTQLLAQLRPRFPDAKKVLLTAYADTSAAIASINEVGLDHYLLKPWHPPEDRLYPVLDDLLAAWRAQARPAFEGIRVVGSRWSRPCYEAKEFLARNLVPYQWLDVERNEQARALVARLGVTAERFPVVLLPDGSHLLAPDRRELASRVGLHTQAGEKFYDLVVVGGGPAGLANSLYGATEGLSTLLVEQDAPGGQAATSSNIENYLGFPGGVSGADLAQRAIAQARRFGVEILSAQEAVSVQRTGSVLTVRLGDDAEVRCHAVLLATGTRGNRLDAPGIDRLLGAGVYYGAAITEAETFRGQDVCIVGGANSAGQGAVFFSRTARQVTMLVRSAGLETSMSHYLSSRIATIPNIRVEPGVVVAEARGAKHLEAIVVRSVNDGTQREIATSALFLFVGGAPRSERFAATVDRDARGFILTGPDLPRENGKPRGWTLERDPFLFETSVPGIFAAGDVRSGANRRVAAAVGEGSAAIYSIQRYLETV